MSKTRQIFELRSPDIRVRNEHFTGLAQPCGYCHGNGWFWDRDEYNEVVKVPCPVCEGTGEVRPEVEIEWKPNKK